MKNQTDNQKYNKLIGLMRKTKTGLSCNCFSIPENESVQLKNYLPE
jgi:hypothetical protein